MNLSISADIQFSDKDGFLDFLGQHELAHQTITRKLQSFGGQTPNYPLTDTPRGDPDWLRNHYAIHQAIASQLLQADPTYLADANLDDPQQFDDWMSAHASLHEQINFRLSIV